MDSKSSLTEGPYFQLTLVIVIRKRADRAERHGRLEESLTNAGKGEGASVGHLSAHQGEGASRFPAGCVELHHCTVWARRLCRTGPLQGAAELVEGKVRPIGSSAAVRRLSTARV